MSDTNNPVIKTDRATRVLLTVIAILLGVIAVGQMSTRAEAQVDGSAGCGSASNPCHVKVLNY